MACVRVLFLFSVFLALALAVGSDDQDRVSFSNGNANSAQRDRSVAEETHHMKSTLLREEEEEDDLDDGGKSEREENEELFGPGDEDGEGQEEGEEEEEEKLQAFPDVPLEKCVRPEWEDVHDVQKYIAWRKFTTDRKKVVALDRLLTANQCKRLLGILKEGSTWLFFGIDKDERKKSKFSPKNNAPWTAVLKTEVFGGSSLWQVIKKIAESLYPIEGDEYTLTKALGYVFRWGDHLTVDGGDHSFPEGLVVQIFLDKWKRNHYGETLILNTNTSVAAGIHPKYGRVAMFPTSVLRLIHPPAIDYTGNQHVIELTLHPSSAVDKITKMQQQEQQHLMETDRRNSEAQTSFFDKHFSLRDKEEEKESSGPPDIKALVKQDYVSDEGKRFAVLDNALDLADVDKLRQFILHHTCYHYDTSTDSSDNVKWVAGLEVAPFVGTRLSLAFQRVVDFFTGTNTYYPYDISCNLIRAADHTLTHKDCQDDEKDVTILVYLNPNWTENLHGETVFFRGNWIQGGEAITAVRPRYGRVVIFDGTFLHSARPPSPTFSAPRYSFAAKYAPSKKAARQKDEGQLDDQFSKDDLPEIIKVEDQVLRVISFLRRDLNDVPPDRERVGLLREELDTLEDRARHGEEILLKELTDLADRVEQLQSMGSYDL